MNEKKNLACKSKSFQNMMLVAGIVSLPIGVLLLSSEAKDTKIVSSGFGILIVGIYAFIQFLIMAVKPYERIDYDDKGIYINESKSNSIFISYSEILNVIQKNARARSISYSFGTIKIATTSDVYAVRYISKVDIVKTSLIQLKEEWKYKNNDK